MQARVVLMSHLGRPDGRVTKDTLRPVADHLATLLPNVSVTFANDCVGPEIEAQVRNLKVGCVLIEFVFHYFIITRTAPCCCLKIFVFIQRKRVWVCARTKASSPLPRNK
jgi:hypothetical protein